MRGNACNYLLGKSRAHDDTVAMAAAQRTFVFYAAVFLCVHVLACYTCLKIPRDQNIAEEFDYEVCSIKDCQLFSSIVSYCNRTTQSLNEEIGCLGTRLESFLTAA